MYSSEQVRVLKNSSEVFSERSYIYAGKIVRSNLQGYDVMYRTPLDFFQCDKDHASIERQKKYIPELYDFADYMKLTESALKNAEVVQMEPWNFLLFLNWKSDSKVKAANMPKLSTLTHIELR